jgi:hypothetical protein
MSPNACYSALGMLVIGAKEEVSVGNIYEQEQKMAEIKEAGRYGMCSACHVDHVFCMSVTEMDYKLLIRLRYL